MPSYTGGGYRRKGVTYQGPTKPRGRPLKATKMEISKAVNKIETKKVSDVVKKEVSKTEEVKCVMNLAVANKVYVYGSGLVYSTLSPNQGWVSLGGLVPSISLGSAVDQRVGNKISPKGLKIKYSIYANPSTEAGSTAMPGGNINPFYGLPFRVKVIIFRHRFAIDEPNQTGIIQAGSVNADLGSDLDTFFRPYNKDEYIIKYSKMFKMQNPRHNLTGTAFTQQNQSPGTSTLIMRTINLKLPQLRFNDATSTCANSQWYIAFAVCNEDNSVITAGSQSRININCESYLYYTDS